MMTTKQIKNKSMVEIFISESPIGDYISKFKRTVYFGKCGHKTYSYINTLDLDTWYWCDECVHFRKISEINY